MLVPGARDGVGVPGAAKEMLGAVDAGDVGK